MHEVVGNEFDPAAMRRLCCLFWLIEDDVGGPIVATGLMASDHWRSHVMIEGGNSVIACIQCYTLDIDVELPPSGLVMCQKAQA